MQSSRVWEDAPPKHGVPKTGDAIFGSSRYVPWNRAGGELQPTVDYKSLMRLNKGLDRALAANENANDAETGTGDEAAWWQKAAV